jgi:hypothetical protein
MSSRTRTLQQLRDGVADRGDLDIAASGVRHTEAIINARINMAIQRWLLLQCEAGDRTNEVRLPTTTSTSATRGAQNWAPREYVTLASGYMLVTGLDIYPAGSTMPISMMPVDDLERNDFGLGRQWWSTGASGMPVFYKKTGIQTSELILVYPWADAVYNVDIYAIPAHTDLSTGSETVDFVCGGEDWVVNEATMKSLLSDGLGAHPNMAQMRAMNRELEQELAFTMAKRGVVRKVDTHAQRRLLQTYWPRGLR